MDDFEVKVGLTAYFPFLELGDPKGIEVDVMNEGKVDEELACANDVTLTIKPGKTKKLFYKIDQFHIKDCGCKLCQL